MPDGSSNNIRSTTLSSSRGGVGPAASSLPTDSGSTRSETHGSNRPTAGQSVLDEILDNPHLPSPPSIALQIVELASNFDADIKDVVRILKVDPAICAKLLKTVNSCIYGLRQPVVTIERAVSIIGFHPLRSLVLGLAIPSLQIRGETESGLRSFWRESVAGAMMARELAVRARDPHAEEIFLSGILRDLGMTLLRQRFAARYDPVWNTRPELRGRRQCEWERETLGLDHAELGAGLLTRWRLPKEIVEPVRHHHFPEKLLGGEPRFQKRAKLIEFCSRLARIENLAENAEALRGVIRTAEDDYGLSSEELRKFLRDVSPKIEAFAEILNIEIGSCSPFAEAMAKGCAELARLAVELSVGPPVHQEDPGSADTACFGPRGGLTVEFQPTGYALDFLDRLKEPGFQFSLNQYRVESVLGRGGMGVVLKAFEPALDRFVALKMISPRLANYPRIRDRFAHEARTAASILHENVVAIFTIGKYQGVSFLVMEYVDGLSIHDHLVARRRFRPAEIARIGRECATGLAAAHRLGVAHRDVKPGNILLRRQGERAQLTDFGLACVVREESHSDSMEPVCGTPEYMSPEQSDGGAVTLATDLYSLGGALFALCTGTHPVPWTTRREMTHYSIPTAIRRANADVPDELIRLIVRLLATEPIARPASAEETAEELAKIGSRLH